MKIIHVFWVLLACNLVCNIAQSIISPFYPIFANNRGVSEDIIGIIFSAQPIGIFVASLIIGKIITQVIVHLYFISIIDQILWIQV